MKAKVIEKFKDKHQKDKNGKPVIHKVDDIIDITEERFKEILETGNYVEKVEEPAEEKVEEPAEEKVEEPAEEKVEEPAEEKVEEPAEEKPAKKKKTDK